MADRYCKHEGHRAKVRRFKSNGWSNGWRCLDCNNARPKSEKAKAAKALYNKSEKAKAAKAKYRNSEKGINNQKKWLEDNKGYHLTQHYRSYKRKWQENNKDKMLLYQRKYNQSEKGKAAQRRNYLNGGLDRVKKYNQSEKGKANRIKVENSPYVRMTRLLYRVEMRDNQRWITG